MESNTSCDFSGLHEVNKKQSTIKNQIKLPSNALALYIKLYCSKKCSKSSKYRSNVIEATKSWITLCEKEKEQFYNKYKECQRKRMQTIGICLQKAEPYMKKTKNIGSQKKNLHDKSTDQEPQSIVTDEDQIQLERIVEQNNFTDSVEYKIEADDNNIPYNEIDPTSMISDIDQNQIHSVHESSNIFYPEPTPPSIKTGKELFEIIKLIDRDKESTWTSLPNKEKCHHNRAVLTLKQDYIVKYKQYLENLSQRDLFDHYNKTFH